jgi:type VI secretion system protein ImpE
LSDARQLFRAGDLRGAVAAQTALIRAAPGNIDKRWFLAELLCFSGDLERAERTLDIIGSQVGAAQVGGAPLNLIVFRQLLRGEEIRRQVLFEGRAPDLSGSGLSDAGAASLNSVIETLMLLRLGENEAAAARLAADPAAPVSGMRNDTAFSDFRDLDDVLAPLLELRPMTQPRDLIWRPAIIEARGGRRYERWIPCLYAARDQAAGDDQVRLGRRTDWSGGDNGPVRGVGLRSFLVGDEDVPIHDLGILEFSVAEPS